MERFKAHRHFLSNVPCLEAEAQTPQLSDHKIFQVSLQLKLGSLKERRFKKSLKLDKPEWVAEQTWRNLLSQAYEAEEDKDCILFRSAQYPGQL